MKYFLPEWDDRVDPKYNFFSDTYSKDHSEDPYENDSYIWDVFGVENVPIDGVLVSRSKLEENSKKLRRIMEQGIHDFLHLPLDFEILGDCGAFGYIDEEKPPFDTTGTLEYYLKAGFNYGASIDHLVVESVRNPDGKRRKLTPKEKEERWETTLVNAKEMYDLWTSKDRYLTNLRIIGVAQGWDVPSYRRAARELLKSGYDYIAVGGLARAASGEIGRVGTTKTVYSVLHEVCYEVKRWCEKQKCKVDVHIFGFARSRLIPELLKMGVSSFDSASLLRSAWLSGKNYFTPKKNYKAIRVPDPRRSPRTKKIVRQKGISQDKLMSLSKRAMGSLRGFSESRGSLHDVLRATEEYGRKVDVAKKHIDGYEEVLQEQPWKSCPCPVCKDLGIEVVIFRGNERNRRRGFHNTYVFYQKLRRLSPRILVFTNCSQKKDKDERLLPAYKRYLGSPLFTAFWNQVYDLPVEIKILSAKYGLLDFSQRIPYYDYRMQEKDVPRFVDELTVELARYDRVFFIGLGLYREIVERVGGRTKVNVEIFPKFKLTHRKQLDVIEYTKQMLEFRQAILDDLQGVYSADDLSHQRMLTEYSK